MHWDTLSRKQQDSLHAEEIQLELSSLDDGITRFREQCATRELSELTPTRRLIAADLDAVKAGIEKKTDAWLTQGRAIRGADYWGLPFAALESDKLAVIALSVMYDLADKDLSLAAITSAIGDKAANEYHFMLLREEAPRLKRMLERRFKNWTPKKVRFALKKAEGLYQYWPAKRQRWVGVALMEIVLEKCKWFEITNTVINSNQTATLSLTDDKRKQILSEVEDMEFLSPQHYPMVVPPNDWKPGEFGGYRYHRLPFVKRMNNWDRPIEDDPVQPHSQRVYDSANYIQQTPWQIHEAVLDIMEICWASNTGQWPDIPQQNEIPHYRESVPYPEEGTDEAKLEWRRQAAMIRERNISLISHRKAFLRHRHIALKMKDYEAIYFPHNLDFRGRVYPIPQDVTPQGCDLARGLLRFADAKPLGPDGFNQLLLVLSACYGHDKMNREARLAWASSVIDEVVNAATDPLSSDFWKESFDEKPWQALACIYEIASAVAWERATGDITTFMSRLPCRVDGSNSGLQHFSAMLLDVEGAVLTNLTPSPEPQDIYGKMAEWVSREVEIDCVRLGATEYPLQDAADIMPACLWWRDRVNRSTLKRGTMTYVYGVTRQGVENYLRKDRFVDDAPEPYEAAKYLRGVIWRGLQENVRAAALVMDWLRACAATAASDEKTLRWVSPAGFVVSQEYLDGGEVTVRTLDRSIRYRVPTSESTIKSYKQRNSTPPNFIHSFDAAHLMLTAVSGHEQGITHWSMVHDEFGTHACDMGVLGVALREELIFIYSVNQMESWKQQIEAYTGVELPDPPPQGDLDINLIREAPHAFA